MLKCIKQLLKKIKGGRNKLATQVNKCYKESSILSERTVNCIDLFTS